MHKEDLKDLACSRLDTLFPLLSQLADYLHEHPELSTKEYLARDYLHKLLEDFDFSYEPVITNKFDTAFMATAGEGPVKIGFLAEYDALPEIGHACGHNLIAMSSVGAALAFNSVTDDIATTVLYGCAAEETTGAKLDMASSGLFDDVEAALIIHPDDHTAIGGTSYATHPLEVTFIGKEAHVADPVYHGINALDALVDFYIQFKSLKETFEGQTLVGMIITEGGKAPNIIPAKASLKATIRSTDTAYLEEVMLPKIRKLAKEVAAQHCTGIEMNHYEPLYMDLCADRKIEEYYQTNFAKLGEDFVVLPDDYADGSTDVGNVSHATRSCQPSIGINPLPSREVTLFTHTKEFAVATGSEFAKQKALIAAKAMVMTAIDILFEVQDEN